MRVGRIIASCLETALPRSCVLCGSPLGPLPPWPLCPGCESELRPWTGPRCECCGLPLISELRLCMRCRGGRRAFERAYPLFSYSGLARELISAYKKQRRRSLAPFFAGLFSRVIEEGWADRVIVPVPPRPEKARAAGWDQVEEIARLLEARGFALARPLERRPGSAQQKKLGRSERGGNARNSYTLKAGASSPSLPLLIDDVVTTCSTLEACALALKEGGAISVEALVLAAD